MWDVKIEGRWGGIKRREQKEETPEDESSGEQTAKCMDAFEEFDPVLLLILQLLCDRRIKMVRFGMFEPLLSSY